MAVLGGTSLSQNAAERMARKFTDRALPENFTVQAERWRNFRFGNGCFFRPTPNYPDMGTLPLYEETGISAELAMWVFETHGVMLPTFDPEGFADLLQGKSIEGLARKEWIADAMTGSFWAEELVVAGLMNFEEAERLFTRKLHGGLLWLFASLQSEM